MEDKKDISSNLLTIIIPTYNRSAALNRNLERIYEFQKKVSFDIVVCNNASTDGVEKIIDYWSSRLDNFTLVSHKNNVGYGCNIISGIKACKTKYFWLLGNKCYFREDSLMKVMKYLDQSPDAIVVNTLSKYDINANIYDDQNEILKDLGWRLSNLCSTIVKREIIDSDLLDDKFSESILTFIHLYIWCVSFSRIHIDKVYYCPDILVENFKMTKEENNVQYWDTKSFSVFGKDWYRVIMSLPDSYTKEAKLKCIKDHAVKTGLFNITHMIAKLLSGSISRMDYFHNRKYLPYVLPHSLYVYDLIFVLVPPVPKFIYGFLYSFYKLLIRYLDK